MSHLRDYARVLAAHLRLSVVLASQYRVEFAVNAVLAIFWTGTAILPLYVLFESRSSLAGWTRYEALLVVAWFTCLKGVLEGAIQPSLQNVVEHMRKGTLDFVLLKPLDAQFLVSTLRFEVWRMGSVLAGFVLAGVALAGANHCPTLGEVALSSALLLSAVATLYSIWTFVISLAFRVVKVDNLSYLFLTLYDLARWPRSVFHGLAAFVFTFVLPFALLTTAPALSTLGRLSTREALISFSVAACFAALSRLAWLRSIRHYTSAGG